MREIGQLAFLDCSEMVSAEFCEGVEDTGFDTFWGSGLVSVTLPSSLRLMPNSFDEALGLSEI